MISELPTYCSRFRTAGLVGTGLALLLYALPGSAEPFVPREDGRVLERVRPSSDPAAQELRRLHRHISQAPDSLSVATELARQYIEIGRAEADPRYLGYAQAALQSWWDDEQPPTQVLLLRATLRQNRHDFEGALADLADVIKVEPDNGQAWLTRAVIQQVQGDYDGALMSCAQLAGKTTELVLATCVSAVASLNGRAEDSYAALRQALETAPATSPDVQLWSLTILAEIAVRLGQDQAAQQHFEQALAIGERDVYLLSAYADLLLSRGHEDRALALLEDETQADPLLLRLALAEKLNGSPGLDGHIADLAARFAASRKRGDPASLHLREEARFTLHLLNLPDRALELATRNWTVQREPQDARIFLEAALATGKPAHAEPVLEWMRRSGIEDRDLRRLAARLEDLDR